MLRMSTFDLSHVREIQDETRVHEESSDLGTIPNHDRGRCSEV